MRIVLLYPPPWKIASPGQASYPPGEGAPESLRVNALDDGDFSQSPYGLLSLAAQAMSSGHHVVTLNLSRLPWQDVESIIRPLSADLFGLSCHTANRRGVAMLAQLIRDLHTEAHIVVGGPHVTALAGEILAHHEAIDTVVVGEGEDSLMELVRCLEYGAPVRGIAGTAWRGVNAIHVEPRRPPIKDLDTLASPADYFSMRTLITSRGCPGRCTFCGSRLMWGRRTRFHSVAYVIEMAEKAVSRHGQKYIAFKDDTFTADRGRALTICEELRHRGLGFYWSCETRADRLDDSLLKAMRRAGCRRISMGVESASKQVLKNIRKNISLDKVLAATKIAQTYGIQVRYYMMVGNRGETYRSFRQSLDFIREARPNQFAFCQLHLYPGTEEFEIFQRHGCVTPEIFFSNEFACLTCFGGKAAELEQIMAELKEIEGIQELPGNGVATCKAIVNKLPDCASAHMDLCAAWLRKGRAEKAQVCLNRALDMHPPMPGLIHNLQACLAAARGDTHAAGRHLEEAAQIFPHLVVIENLNRLNDWLDGGGASNSGPLVLASGGEFETHYFPEQPEGPGPIDLPRGSWPETANRTVWK